MSVVWDPGQDWIQIFDRLLKHPQVLKVQIIWRFTSVVVKERFLKWNDDEKSKNFIMIPKIGLWDCNTVWRKWFEKIDHPYLAQSILNQRNDRVQASWCLKKEKNLEQIGKGKVVNEWTMRLDEIHLFRDQHGVVAATSALREHQVSHLHPLH